MAILTVTSTADVVNPKDGLVSLREAIQQANASAAVDTIRFAAGLEGRTLVLTGGQLEVTADLVIKGDLNGDGAGAIIDGARNGRVLSISSSTTEVTLSGLTLTGGHMEDDRQNGGAIFLGGGSLTLDGCTVRDSGTAGRHGGGIYADAGSRLTIDASSILDNAAYAGGGGIGAGSNVTLVVRDSLFTGNSSGHYGSGGGAIATGPGSSLLIEDSTLSGNQAYAGGALFVTQGNATIRRSTIADNSAAYGGGVEAVAGRTTIVDSTVADNRADYGVGGGIAVLSRGELSIVSSTITGNRAISHGPADEVTIGGGISVGLITIADSIVAGNSLAPDGGETTSGPDIHGAILTSNGHNIFGSLVQGAAAGDLLNVPAIRLFAAVDPVTGGGSLAFNGGPTATVALKDDPANPALGDAEPAAGLDTDQRGLSRPQPVGSNPDIGAFELAQTRLSASPSDGNDVLVGTNGADTLQALAGNDLVRGMSGDDRLYGNQGSDTLEGGAGNDLIDGGQDIDTATYATARAGIKVSLAITTAQATGISGTDRLVSIENLIGSSYADTLTGDASGNRLAGGGGKDGLAGGDGNDVLLGKLDNDTLHGGLGRDTLRGGAGKDVFVYRSVGETGPDPALWDVLIDFAQGDRIDLAGIDADDRLSGNQAFSRFVGTGALTGAGLVGCFTADGDTIVHGSIDADGAAEFAIRLDGIIALSHADFVL